MLSRAVFSRHGSSGWQLAGSSLQVNCKILLTCDHVLRSDKQHPHSQPFAAHELSVGAAHYPVARVIPADAGGRDLAIMELNEPLDGPPASFSKQWTIPNVYGFGFDGPPFDEAQSDGPLQLPPRDNSGHVPFQYGMPEGFSGGPAIGSFREAQYCVGLNRMGGIGYATGVLIPAVRCAEFLNHHYPGICRLQDLSVRDLELFLLAQDACLKMRRERGGGRIATSFARGKVANTQAPLLDISKINATTLKCLQHGDLNVRIAVALDGRQFLGHLRGEPVYPDIDATLLRYLRESGPMRLEFPGLFQQALREGRVVLVVLGYERAYLGDDYDLVRNFMNRFAARTTYE